MSVHISYWGDTGNNMFQYAFARIIAEELNYKLYGDCDKLKDFNFPAL